MRVRGRRRVPKLHAYVRGSVYTLPEMQCRIRAGTGTLEEKRTDPPTRMSALSSPGILTDMLRRRGEWGGTVMLGEREESERAFSGELPTAARGSRVADRCLAAACATHGGGRKREEKKQGTGLLVWQQEQMCKRRARESRSSGNLQTRGARGKRGRKPNCHVDPPRRVSTASLSCNPRSASFTTGHTPQLHSVAVRLPLRAGP